MYCDSCYAEKRPGEWVRRAIVALRVGDGDTKFRTHVTADGHHIKQEDLWGGFCR